MPNGSPEPHNPKRMNIAVWIAQGMLCLAFVMASGVKFALSEIALSKKLPWTNDFSMKQVRTIGLLEFLGAAGVVIPRAVGVLPILTPIAAIGLCCVMIGAAVTHIRREEYGMLPVNFLLFSLAAFVAVVLLTGIA